MTVNPRGDNAEGSHVKSCRSNALESKIEEVPTIPKLAVSLEVIAEESNLRAAFEEVRKNKGAPGVDRQSVNEVRIKLDRIIPELKLQLLEERYRPGEIRRVWIPKGNGEKRGLGIPNVIDRIVQQAVNRKLQAEYDPEFCESSHGFRPNKSCHTAIAEAKSYIEEGYSWVVDMDLEKFFDKVNHDRLMSQLKQRIEDKKLLRLINSMLKAKIVLSDGVKVANEEGVPQGGPLSPLLSNIVLDELDKELRNRGHKFVRYADDCNIYVKSERAGKRVLESISKFIEKKLKLKVNQEKSAVSKPEKRHFLGFSLGKNKRNGKVEIKLSPRTRKRIASKIVELTPRNWGQSLDDCIKKLNTYLEGWMGYFRICTTSEQRQLKIYDAHIRRRLRAIKLKHWKRKRNIARALVTLGVSRKLAWRQVYTGKQSLWNLSHNMAVERGLKNSFFEDLGLKSLALLWDYHYYKDLTVYR